MANGARTWELTDLPAIDEEEHAPGIHSLQPWLAVTLFLPSDNTAGLPLWKDWAGVSNWLSGLVEPSAAVSTSIRAKTGSLIAGAQTDLDKIRAIAAYVQNVNYVSVQMNLTHRGGYTPHPADQVLSANYGDCKDKATLMKALLAAAGIESFVTAAYSGDSRHVQAEWSSPMQFNHAIVAVRVSSETDLPAAADYGRLGKLLFFDPTDPYTPLGDLPLEEQASRMLVLAGPQGELVSAPTVKSEASRKESTVEAQLAPSGTLSVKLVREQLARAPVRCGPRWPCVVKTGCGVYLKVLLPNAWEASNSHRWRLPIALRTGVSM